MNRLSGRIAAVEVAGSIALVDVAVGARRYTATLIGAGEEVAAWRESMPATLLFKETEVSLARNLSGLISMRNRLPGRVTAIERGSLLTRVCFEVDGDPIAAVITTRSCDMLQLAVGVEVEGLVKANEMSVFTAPQA
jgi:molybdate transport system regulatory protein